MTEPKPIDVGMINRFIDEFAVEQVQTYFKSGNYTGSHFERFAGGGDSPETRDRFTSDDLVATSFVGVRVPGRAALEILVDHPDELNDLLSQIPVDVDLWEASDEVVGPKSAAEQLWARLAELPGMNRVSSGKLLARKRPRLIPVYDKVIWKALLRDEQDEWWGPLRDVLQKQSSILTGLTKVRTESRVGDDISLLRVLYVVLWMRSFGRPEPQPDAHT
jgi:hypothetical protein